MDCDFSTGRCPECGYAAAPHVRRNCPQKRAVIPSGPGTELMALITELGLKKPAGCQCAKRARQMDAWGIEGCHAHREELLAKLKENYEVYGLVDKLTAAAKAMTSGLAWRIDPRRPLESLLDLAIERAEAHHHSDG